MVVVVKLAILTVWFPSELNDLWFLAHTFTSPSFNYASIVGSGTSDGKGRWACIAPNNQPHEGLDGYLLHQSDDVV